MVATAPPRDDALDIEAFETMIASAPFAAFTSRVRDELRRHALTCETSPDSTAIIRAQGAAHALRVVLDLPQGMLKTMKDKTWKAEK
jgi:hypothetical protein